MQWHPEFLIDPADARIFHALVDGGGRVSESEPVEQTERGERIAKWLARAGVASRRDAEKLLTEKCRAGSTASARWSTRRRSCSADDVVQVRGKVVVDVPGAERGCGATTSRTGW